MAKVRSTTIRLTPGQRAQIKKITGQDHASVKFEAVPPIPTKRTLTVRSALTSRVNPGGGRVQPKGPILP